MQKTYLDFTEEQLLQDPYFIKWVKYRNVNDDAFWSDLITSNPSNLKEIESAVLKLTIMLSADKTDEESISKEQVWNSISNSINSAKIGIRPVLHKWLAAASVIFIVTFLGIYVTNNSGTIENNQIVSTKLDEIKDIAPGGNKAILTLGNGQTIVLDSAGNGTLSTQGSSTITKLADGQIAYEGDNKGSQSAIVYNTISTPRGGQYNLTLSDGSKVWLNAESSLRFPASFSGTERLVELTGEGYFEVAHNADKPFQVAVNHSVVEVLGTYFNIKAYSDESNLRTTLLQGSVRVSKGSETVLIKPGQQAVVNNSTNTISINNNTNPEEVIAWKNGLFYFDNTTVKEVMRQVGRWYDLEVVFEGNIPDKKITGKIYRNVNVYKVLRIMEALKIQFKIEGRKIIVTE